MKSPMKSTTLRNCNNVFDTVIHRFELKNDAALARQLGVAPPVISKCRKGTLTIGATLMIRIHDVFGMSIEMIRSLGEEEVPA